MRRPLARGRPRRSDGWVQAVVQRLGLPSSIRPRGSAMETTKRGAERLTIRREFFPQILARGFYFLPFVHMIDTLLQMGIAALDTGEYVTYSPQASPGLTEENNGQKACQVSDRPFCEREQRNL